MGNVYPEDNWKVHFREHERGGKYAEQLAHGPAPRPRGPDRGARAGAWGALFRQDGLTDVSPSVISAVTATRASRTWGTAPGLNSSEPCSKSRQHGQSTCSWSARSLRLLRDADGGCRVRIGLTRPSGEFVTFAAKA